MGKKRVIFVGNGLPRQNISKEIDAFDYVIRSSTCMGFGKKYGSKIDVWCTRADNTRRGQETATGHITVPVEAVRQAKLIIVVKQKVNPTIGQLTQRFPVMRHKPIIAIDLKQAHDRMKQVPGVNPKLHPTMGFTIFHAIDQIPELQEMFDFWCCGFSWDTVTPEWHNIEAETKVIGNYSWLHRLELAL